MLSKPLSTIVSEFLGSADRSNHDYVRTYNLARRGCQNEFNLDITGSFRTELLDINPNKTVQIPDWCISFSKIGIINEANEIVTLKVNDQLTTYHGIYYGNADRTAGVPTLNTFDVNDSVPTGQPYFYPGYYLNFYNSGSSFNLFGLPSGTPTIGTYTIDVASNVILLNSEFPYSQILLEGLSDGTPSENEDYMIPIQAAEAMLYWIRWQNMIDKPRVYGMGERNMAKKEYFNEKRKAAVRLNPANIIQLQNAERESWKLTAKA